MGIPYIISYAGRKEVRTFDLLENLSTNFLKSQHSYTSLKNRAVTYCVLVYWLTLWKNSWLFMKEIPHCSITVSVLLCMWALAITGINLGSKIVLSCSMTCWIIVIRWSVTEAASEEALWGYTSAHWGIMHTTTM